MGQEEEKGKAQRPKHEHTIYARFNCPLCKALGTLCVVHNLTIPSYPGGVVKCCSCNSNVIVGKESMELVGTHC
jgi:transcription elongation factor Elf1